jgi:hypothetical protein
MADIRFPSSGLPANPSPARPQSPARTAAQRAFFQAAVQQAEAAAPVRTAAAVERPVPAVARAAPAAAPAAEEPQRYRRPGSLIDIKV